jgi:large subunit ribosomal protein L32e
MRYSKLGRGRRKKQKWKKPKGRDNKMREKRRGYPSVVSIGYGSTRKERGTINGKKIRIVHNLNELQDTNIGNYSVIFANVGKKKRIAMAIYAKEHKIPVINLNVNKFLIEERK